MIEPFRYSAAASLLILLVPLQMASAVPTIDVGTHELLPDTPGQVVQIHVSGGDLVQGMNLFIMVANGGPELELIGELPPGAGIAGPAITFADAITGTIFASNNLGQNYVPDGDVDLPQIATVYAITQSGTVPAEGLLVTITLDTTGFFHGTFALSLTVLGVQSDFAGIPAQITDGFIVIPSDEVPSDDPPDNPPDDPPVPNLPPTADAGPDQTVNGATTVHLAGQGSDPELQSLTYAWRQLDGPAVVLSDPSSATPTFVAPSGLINTRLTFELSVSDGEHTTVDTVTIFVNSSQLLFSVDAGPDQSVAAGALVQLSAALSPQPLGTPAYEWFQTGGPSVILNGGNSSQASFTAPVGLANTWLAFEVRVFDGTYEAADTVRVMVNANTQYPAAYAGEDQAVDAGAAVQLTGSGTDPVGAGLTYAWVQIDGPEVVLSDAAIADPTFTAPSSLTASRLEFELRVSSGALTSADTVVVHVAAAPPVPPETPPTGGVPAEQDPGSAPAESANYQSTSSTTQSPWDFSSWSTTTLLVVGMALLILALLLLWLIWL